MPSENYILKGIKFIDGVPYIPLLEIVTLCRLYPKITGEQLQNLIATAYKNLENDEELKKKIPIAEVKKKSIIQKFFQRSPTDASSQKT